MNTDARFVDAALRSWKSNADRTAAFFDGLSNDQLEHEVAPGRNRLLYLLGHLAAVSDAMLPLLGLGERRHPELDEAFLENADRAVASPLPTSALRKVARDIDDAVWSAFTRLPAAAWLDRHTAVSAEEFAKEPHRSRFSVLLSRTAHMGFHYGQMVLTKARSSATS